MKNTRIKTGKFTFENRVSFDKPIADMAPAVKDRVLELLLLEAANHVELFSQLADAERAAVAEANNWQ